MAREKRLFSNVPKELIECSHCHLVLPKKSFYKNKRYKNGHSSTCKECNSSLRKEKYNENPEKYKQIQKHLRINAKDKIRGYRYKRNYNISLETYNSMVRLQNGKCAICGNIPNYHLRVDHSHETGEIRGLLCDSCNKLLGFSSENISILIQAINYINKYQCGVYDKANKIG